jgi:hypothetical protein
MVLVVIVRSNFDAQKKKKFFFWKAVNFFVIKEPTRRYGVNRPMGTLDIKQIQSK